MKKVTGIFVGTLFAVSLSGCTTPELRGEKPVDDKLDFSTLKKTATDCEMAAKGTQ